MAENKTIDALLKEGPSLTLDPTGEFKDLVVEKNAGGEKQPAVFEEARYLTPEEIKQVDAFAEQIQTAVADKDLEALADLAAYPLYVGFADGGQSVESRDEFIALGADRIFTEELLSEIAGADTEGLEASMAGFSLSASGRPNVIFGVADGRLAIVGMNY